MTALEDVVFVAGEGNIPVYISAKGTRIVNYGFKSGVYYRESKMGETDYADDRFFRSSAKDKEILPQKLAELFLIGTSPLASYEATHKGFLSICISKLIALASKDYCMDDEDKGQFVANVEKIYASMKYSPNPSDEQNAEVVVLGAGFVHCNSMLGGAGITEAEFPSF